MRPPNGDGSTTRIEINQSTEKEICHDNSSSNHERVHQSMKSFFCVSTFTRSSSSLDTDKARLRRLSVLMRKIEKVDFFLFILSAASQRHKAGEQEGEWEVSWGERKARTKTNKSLTCDSLTHRLCCYHSSAPSNSSVPDSLMNNKIFHLIHSFSSPPLSSLNASCRLHCWNSLRALPFW